MAIEDNIKKALNGGHQAKISTAWHGDLLRELEKIKKENPHLDDVLENLILLAGVIMQETGTPNQRGSITRVLNTLKQQKVGARKIEHYLRRKARF